MNPEHAHEERFTVRWSDLDANRHLRNTAFSEYATHTRLRMLQVHGFSQQSFETLRFGPVLFREDIRYRREVVFGDHVTVNVLIAGLSPDGSHWRVRQEVRREDGSEAAVLLIDGAWLDLDARRLTVPTPELVDILGRLPRTREFEELRSVIRRAGQRSDPRADADQSSVSDVA
jgi:acyl-CoA thioester hydrolase